MKLNEGKIIRYIQGELFNGKQPTETGHYVFSRKELAEGVGISVSTVDNCKDAVTKYFSSFCDLKTWAKYDEYAGEILYIDVSFEKGKLKFKRNPITFEPHLSHLWALPPLNDWFAYDVFDDKHRRRCNCSVATYDAIPWDWDADLWEQVIQDGNDERIKTIISNPPQDSILLQQAKEIYSVFDIVLLMEGYKPKTLAKSLYAAVRDTLPELCEFLLANGADPNEIVQQGYSSMQMVSGIDKGEVWAKVVKLLIDNGGDLTWGNFNTVSFAESVFSNGSDELCKYYIDALYKQGLLDFVSVTGQTPLSVAKTFKGYESDIVSYIEQLLEK